MRENVKFILKMYRWNIDSRLRRNIEIGDNWYSWSQYTRDGFSFYPDNQFSGLICVKYVAIVYIKTTYYTDIKNHIYMILKSIVYIVNLDLLHSTSRKLSISRYMTSFSAFISKYYKTTIKFLFHTFVCVIQNHLLSRMRSKTYFSEPRHYAKYDKILKV